MTRTRIDNSVDSVHPCITVVDLALFVVVAVGYEKRRQVPRTNTQTEKAKTKKIKMRRKEIP